MVITQHFELFSVSILHVYSYCAIFHWGGDTVKKLLRKVVDAFLIVLTGVFCGFVLIFAIPFDFIAYIRSPYYKTERKKYKLYAGSSEHFALYNEIVRNALPIKYIHNPVVDELQCGWFVFGSTLIIPCEFPLTYNAESGDWIFCTEEGEDGESGMQILLSLEEYLATDVCEANSLAGEKICQQAVALIDEDSIDNIEAAKNDKRLLVYNDNRVKVLKSYCDRYI